MRISPPWGAPLVPRQPQTTQATGQRDAREAALWASLFQAPGSPHLTELDQDEFTWWGASSQSRLDRIYSSHTVDD